MKPNWTLPLAVTIVSLLAGCGGNTLSTVGMPNVSVGKFRARSLHSDKSLFSRHHLVVRMAPGAKSPIAGVTVRPGFGDRVIHNLPDGITADQAMAAYQQAPGVLSIEKLELFPVEEEPGAGGAVPQAPAPMLATNDTMYFQQWGHAVAHVPHAWEISRGRPDVVVGVLDTGVDYTHPDLAGQVINGPDFAENKEDSKDIGEHGTHVAGIIAAKANNGQGVAGLAPNARILSLKIFEPYFDNGAFKGTYYQAYSLARAVQYAATQGNAKIINVSAGIADDELVESMFAFARGKGVVICVSAGNTGSNTYTGGPKTMDGVLAVHATDAMDRLARFSNYGSTLGVSAPGMAIMSTVPTYANPYTGEPANRLGYESLSGTSMASPFVAGVAALVVSALEDSVESYLKTTTGNEVELTAQDIPGTVVEDLIRSTCADLGRPGRDEVYGCGRVDAGRALEACTDDAWVERTAKEIARNRRR